MLAGLGVVLPQSAAHGLAHLALQLPSEQDELRLLLHGEVLLRAALSRPDKDQAQLAKLVEEASTVDRDLATVAEDSFRDAQKDLTAEQQAKLVLLRRELQGQVREAVRRRLGQHNAKPGEHETGTKPHR